MLNLNSKISASKNLYNILVFNEFLHFFRCLDLCQIEKNGPIRYNISQNIGCFVYFLGIGRAFASLAGTRRKKN